MELIALNVGLELGVISPTLFAMMVIMALATTMATGPLLQLLIPAVLPAKPREPALDAAATHPLLASAVCVVPASPAAVPVST